MSDYKAIHGVKIRDYTTDPDNLIVGQVWFDKTNNVLQFQEAGAGAWATGSNLNTARQQLAGAGVSNTAALAFGGSPDEKNETELYNGSSWTELNNLNTARFEVGGTGTSTSALSIGGELPGGNTAVNESWNGTSWTEVAQINSARA